jgi:hypothetical protein
VDQIDRWAGLYKYFTDDLDYKICSRENLQWYGVPYETSEAVEKRREKTLLVTSQRPKKLPINQAVKPQRYEIHKLETELYIPVVLSLKRY